MTLELDGFLIEDNFIHATFDTDQEIYFSGKALDEDGRRITSTLGSMKGKILEVKFSQPRDVLVHHEGIYELYKLEVKPREEIREGRYIYRFRGRLRPVH